MSTRLKSSKIHVFLGFTVFLLIVAVAGCSSGESDESDESIVPEEATAKAENSPPPTVEKIESAATTEPSDPEPTKVPSPIKQPTSAPAPTAAPAPTVAPTATSKPAPTATPPPTATPAPLTNIYKQFGFTVELDEDASFATSSLNIADWLGSTADSSQGLMTFNYNGANIILFWQPQAVSTTQETIDLTYQLQQLSNPDRSFALFNNGDVTVDGSDGRYAGFLSTNASGGDATGGLIGAWSCADSGTQLSMTATGPDSTALQIRFDRLISGFSCE
ncbi:MAG: hypothetical protein HOL69_03425 [Chloroflexi bacterium]|nr:hypothetical protein [Chloroflexota bacterium]